MNAPAAPLVARLRAEIASLREEARVQKQEAERYYELYSQLAAAGQKGSSYEHQGVSDPAAPTLAELDKAATQGKWNLQHEDTFVAGPLVGDKERGFDWEWVVQELPAFDAHTYLTEDYERHKANCRFIVAVVNAYRAGRLREVPPMDAEIRRMTYARRNPLGGPATRFEAVASRLRAGDDYAETLKDFGLADVPEGEYICTCGIRVAPHRCPTGSDF